MIINESRVYNKLNETKSINLGNGKTAYQYGGKFYLNDGKGNKKEISSDEYNKLRSKDQGSKSNGSSSSDKSNADLMNNLKDTYKLEKNGDNWFSINTDDPVKDSKKLAKDLVNLGFEKTYSDIDRENGYSSIDYTKGNLEIRIHSSRDDHTADIVVSNIDNNKSNDNTYSDEYASEYNRKMDSPEWDFEREIEDNFAQSGIDDEYKDDWLDMDYYDKLADLDYLDGKLFNGDNYKDLSNKQKVDIIDNFFNK